MGRSAFRSLVAWSALAASAWGAGLSFTAADAQTAYETAAGLVKSCTPRNAGTPEGLRAAAWIRDRAVAAGVPAKLDVFTAAVNDGEAVFANVVAELPGSEPAAPWIVLMSHFDTAPNAGRGFEGANDGASTSGLLLALGQAVRHASHGRLNVLLAWTDAEECRVKYGPRDGFQGSRRLLRDLRERGRSVRAAICLDMLGDRNLDIILPANSDPRLVRLALQAAQTTGFGRIRHCDDIVVKDDHSAFHDAGLPALDLIDFEFGSAPGLNDYWHTPQDTLDKISSASLLASGRLAAELVRLLQR